MKAIETENLGKRFDSGWAVESVDLTVAKSEVVGVVGPSGAGKSVLMNLLIGRERPTEGCIRVLGADPLTGNAHERMGWLRETVDLDPRVTGWEHLDHAVGSTGGPKAPSELLGRVGIEPEDATRPAETYPTGARRRIGLAMALAGDPDLLLVEEPAAGLDDGGVATLDAVVREVAESGATVVLFARQWSGVLDACDRVGYLDGGHLDAVVDRGDPDVGREAIELHVDRVPTLALESIPGVEEVATATGCITAVVSDPAAKATVVLEVGHADVAVEDLQVSPLDAGRDGPEGPSVRFTSGHDRTR
jgi:ABC-2 type transport system ATP-binding protein